MKHVLINLMLITLISISAAGCTVVRIMQTRGGYAVEKTVRNTEERRRQLSRRDFRLGFDASESRLGIRLEYRPYYNVEKRELVTYKPKEGGRPLEVLMGLASVGLLSWAVFDNLVETGEVKINDEGELYNVHELDWNRASVLQKSIMIGVPLDTILWAYYATEYEATVHEPWKRRGEIIGQWQLLGNHPYRIDLPTYNFGKEYLSESGNESVPITKFLAEIKSPASSMEIDSVTLHASTKFDGTSYRKTVKLNTQAQLQPFRDMMPQGPKVHVLLILLGNDENIRSSVEKNKNLMTGLLQQVSQYADVYLTVMTSEDAVIGEVTTMKLSSRGASDVKPVPQGLIKGDQVYDWLNNLRVGQHDTILIYYNGHGEIRDFDDKHILNFDQQTRDIVLRATLRDRLEQKPARLKMLITDTCSNRAGTPSPGLVAKNPSYATVRPRMRPYIKNLFLQHKGTLDITAVKPGYYAWGSPDIGGYFTVGILQSFTLESDTNQDRFLTWEEVFKTAQLKTNELFQLANKHANFDISGQLKMEKAGQETQEPVVHSFPKRAD